MQDCPWTTDLSRWSRSSEDNEGIIVSASRELSKYKDLRKEKTVLLYQGYTVYDQNAKLIEKDDLFTPLAL